MLFPSTLPVGTPELMRVSEFHRTLDGAHPSLLADSPSTRAARLGPSLMQDLMRFEGPGCVPEPLAVLAACIRHGRDLLLQLEFEGHVLPLTVFPVQGWVHSPVRLPQWLERPLSGLQVLHVEPALSKLPPERERLLLSRRGELWPLGSLLWELALRGSRGDLLPEIAGPAAYRIAPSVDLGNLALAGTLLSAVQRLQRQTCSLREIAGWPGFDRERAMRMLNGLYLQAALIVSRAHPAATNDGWSAEPR